MEETNMIESQMTDMVTTEPTIKASSTSLSSENEELQRLEHAPPFWRPNNHRKRLSKQLSMCETPRDIAWERRRRQIMRQERMKKHHQAEMSMIDSGDQDILIDDALNELKGCIQLGFGFNELDQDGKRQLCHTLPALDLYFAVNRQVSPVSTPTTTNSSNRLSLGGGDQSSSRSLGSRSSSFDSPGSDNPQQVKTKLRHWAQAVACSVMQSS
ncbi:hypothetical protein RHMOL_Rhmol01G0127000 [Rhododendron molle]|uniref:Uncharacterized protein n=1 Tax=Rhododendron molle TaxID=49168 RepID=A0ACC0Q1B5_RHOML|nr:hypothetical protein RHMOL_Rhmol01G0127000 [Rhododendron molle]